MLYKPWPFKQNYLATVFKVMQFGFEIFQSVLSLNCKIIEVYIRGIDVYITYYSLKYYKEKTASGVSF